MSTQNQNKSKAEETPFKKEVDQIAKTCKEGDVIVWQYRLKKDEDGKYIEERKYDESINVYSEEAYEEYVVDRKGKESYLTKMGYFYQVLRKI